MVLTIYTDGGAIGNPGPAASAYVIFEGDTIIAQEGRSIGHGTNNQAEYQALIFAFEQVIALTQGALVAFDSIKVFADSELLVRQLNGLYKVKNAQIRDYILKIHMLETELNVPISYTHVYREKNTLADSLVKKVLGI